MLSEDGMQVGFHTGVIQEARAAQALLKAPAGFDLLLGHVLIDIEEAGERGVRPSWSHTIELLTATAPPDWRERIAGYDPLVVARTTPTDASLDERSAAIAAIWSWYEQHRVWLPRDRPGQLLDDLRAIRLLAASGITEELRDRLRAATTSDDPTTRGSAIAVLVEIGDTGAAHAALGLLVTNLDPVVRRRAAAAAWDLQATDMLPALRARLDIETDDLALRTLAQVTIALIPEDQVTALLKSLPAHLRGHAWWVLDHRWTSPQQLRQLVDLQGYEDDEWTAEWLDELLRDRNARDWGEAELRLLIRLLLTREAFGLIDHQIVRMLAERHPESVWAEGLQHAHDLNDLITLHTLARLDDDTITSLAVTMTNPDATGAVTSYLSWRSQPPPAPPTPTPPPPPARPSLADLIDINDLPQLFRRDRVPPSSAGSTQSGVADSPTGSPRRCWRGWPHLSRRRKSPGRRNPSGLSPPASIWRMTWWAALDLPVDAAAWARLARQPLYAAGVSDWLTSRFNPAFADQVASDLPDWPPAVLEHLVALLPDQWPPTLATALAKACWTSQAEESTRRRCAAQLAANGQREALQQLRADRNDPLVDEALVQLGDCDAEARLLDAMLAEGPTWPITTPSVDLSHHWLTSIRCAMSAERLVQVLRTLLLAGANSAELASVFAALLAAAGPAALIHVERLANDPTLTEGPFLWYRRQELLDEILEQHARALRPSDFRGLEISFLRPSPHETTTGDSAADLPGSCHIRSDL